MVCNKCREEINDNSKFCNHCGHTINNYEIDDTSQLNNNNKKKYVYITGAIVAVFLFIIMTNVVSYLNHQSKITTTFKQGVVEFNLQNYQIAETYFNMIPPENKNYEQARTNIKEIQNIYKQQASDKVSQAHVLLNNNEFEQAIILSNEALDIIPNYKDALDMKDKIIEARALGKVEEARILFEKKDIINAEILISESETIFSNVLKSSAYISLKKAIEQYKNTEKAIELLYLAQKNFNDSDFNTAKTNIEKAFALDSSLKMEYISLLDLTNTKILEIETKTIKENEIRANLIKRYDSKGFGYSIDYLNSWILDDELSGYDTNLVMEVVLFKPDNDIRRSIALIAGYSNNYDAGIFKATIKELVS